MGYTVSSGQPGLQSDTLAQKEEVEVVRSRGDGRGSGVRKGGKGQRKEKSSLNKHLSLLDIFPTCIK